MVNKRGVKAAKVNSVQEVAKADRSQDRVELVKGRSEVEGGAERRLAREIVSGLSRSWQRQQKIVSVLAEE